MVTLGQRINLCRERHQQASPFPPESAELLGIESYVAMQSRGMPVAPAAGPADARGCRCRPHAVPAAPRPIEPVVRAVPRRQLGGRKLAGAPIPQGHANAYPIYRLEWQVGRLAAAPAAQLHERRAGRGAAVQLDRDGRTRAVPRAAQRRHEGRDARGQTLESGPEGPAGARRKPTRRRITRSSLPQLPAGPAARRRSADAQKAHAMNEHTRTGVKPRAAGRR